MKTAEILRREDSILRAIQNSLSLLTTVIPTHQRHEFKTKVAYASSPITTGKRMYDIFKKHGVSSVAELNAIDPKIFHQKIMMANINNGNRFGKELRGAGIIVVIAPGAFFANGWAQEHYMSLWEQVIIRYSENILFNTGYHLSNGCVEELLIAMIHGKDLFHRKGMAPLNPFVEVRKVRQAIDTISDIGADCKKLYDLYRRITLFLESDKSEKYRKQFSI